MKLITPKLQTFHAAVLAGGRSRRMGIDKRFLEFEGGALVDRALATARAAVNGRVMLCGSVPGYDCLPDRRADLGPLSGILAALEQGLTMGSANSAVLIFPVDMPLLSPLLLQCLELKAREGWPVGCQAIGFNASELPLLVKCEESVRRAVEDLLEDPDPRARSVRKLSERLHVLRLESAAEDAELFANTNTPAEWRQIVDRVHA
mgnify:CR=1 FL=1